MYKGEEEVLEAIAKKGRMSLEAIAAATGMNLDHVRKVVESLRGNGYLSTQLEEKEKLELTSEAAEALSKKMLPEFAIYNKPQGTKIAELNDAEKNFGLRWAKVKGYIDIENGVLKKKKADEEVERELSTLLNALAEIKENGNSAQKELLDEFSRRKFLVRSVQKTIVATPTGKKFTAKAETFDINIESKDAEIGKNHPVTKMTEKIKRVFVEMGFEEMDGSLIESSFWNFDALFQPQDHPARELADTFYIKGEAELPDKQLVKRVKEAHEKGWGYEWKESEAKKLVLRTHTTALSARYLSKLKKGDAKRYFAIGRVFRNEATDYSHLAEFHQVEGIVSWEKATFRDLLGIIKEFYKRMGFEQIRFRPSYFPYTEPSVEVEIFYEPKKKWLEIGGAGIFRPEVSYPLYGSYPVLAWGLSLERPLMLELEVGDIRTLYKNDLNFLKGTRMK